jgi:hypothetical protein
MAQIRTGLREQVGQVESLHAWLGRTAIVADGRVEKPPSGQISNVEEGMPNDEV